MDESMCLEGLLYQGKLSKEMWGSSRSFGDFRVRHADIVERLTSPKARKGIAILDGASSNWLLHAFKPCNQIKDIVHP
jgi:hypothetical protein